MEYFMLSMKKKICLNIGPSNRYVLWKWRVGHGRGEIGAGAAAPVQVWACGPSSLHGSAASRELRVIFGAGRQTENRGIRSFAPLMFLGRLLSCLQLGSKASLLKFRTRTRLGNSWLVTPSALFFRSAASQEPARWPSLFLISLWVMAGHPSLEYWLHLLSPTAIGSF